MTTIEDIIKNTYILTFDHEADYDWLNIVEVFIGSEDIASDVVKQKLINHAESKEKLIYWRDLFFMEIAEQENALETNNLFEKIIAHPLFIENKKFIEQLPKATTKLGRELLIDTLINNEKADILVPDDILEVALKKKSRDDLRADFAEWNKEGNLSKKGFNYIKYFVAACLIGIMATVGYNILYDNSYDFDGSQFVSTTEKVIIRGNGLGFVGDKGESPITTQIVDYNKATLADQSNSSKLTINSYSLVNKKLRLVLADSPNSIEIIEFEQNQFYVKVNSDFYKIETSNSFKKLLKLNDKKSIEKLEQILFENE